MQSKGLIRCLPWLSASLLVASGAAQVMQPTGTFPPGPRQRQIQPPPQQHEKPSSGAAEVHTGAVASPLTLTMADLQDDDPDVYRMIQKADTLGVFQIGALHPREQ